MKNCIGCIFFAIFFIILGMFLYKYRENILNYIIESYDNSVSYVKKEWNED